MEAPDIAGISEGIKNSTKANIAEQLNESQIEPSCTVGISISNSPDLNNLGFTNLHIQDAMVEVTRYLLVNNCKLIYAGDLRKDGFTFIFSELAKQYSNPKNYNSYRAVNYFAWPIHINLSRLDDSEFKASNIQIEKLPPPSNVTVDANVFIKPESLPDKVIWAKSLTSMRKTVVDVSQARILIGGQVKNYLGIIPGLVEEGLYSIRNKRPIYLCGAFGGATKALIDAIFTGNTEVLTNKFQHENTSYKELYEYWNNNEQEIIDYPKLVQELNKFGIAGLCSSNGLSEPENRRLSETQHIPEMIYLIIRGLKNINLL